MKGIGYRYNNDDGNACVEYHVDNLPENIYEQEIHPKLPYGGRLSIQKHENEKPLVQFQQDECIFHAFITNAGMDHEVRHQSSQKMKVMALWSVHFKVENLDLECTWMQKN